MMQLLGQLGEMQKELPPVIHVTGTNGKGSTVEMIATGLAALGKTVGVFTSPFLVHEGDSIRIFTPATEGSNAGPTITSLTEEDMSNARYEPEREASRMGYDTPTDFEILFAAALVYFVFIHHNEFPLDYIVVEVGMGGRDDATNVFPQSTCVLTGVSLDHQAFLGRTTRKICETKCGILKPGSDFIINGEMPRRLLAVAKREFKKIAGDGTLVMVSNDDVQNYIPPLNGPHQKILMGIAVEVIRRCVPYASTDNITRAIGLTKLPGRLELRNDQPKVPFPLILDGAHNRESAIALREFVDLQLVLQKKHKVVWVIATSLGRSGILRSLLRPNDTCLCIKFASKQEGTASWIKPVPPSFLFEVAKPLCENSTAFDGLIGDALSTLTVSEDDLVVVAGSLYLVRNYLLHLL